ncbi:DUF4880 domain-containing protein [Asticcacaulis sp. SL142]|uniref:FecR family protein n=1 Tax=Asticcacaulis sp. SL142 TaxID=2995155 RepID=UPI00226C9EB4|nr:DUF4880 domain-containing protein [Asticcacaulis sp. SL142]WAC49791.1 DUF4880 domain-containing protein [Asticcacaulis sp. SL142]
MTASDEPQADDLLTTAGLWLARLDSGSATADDFNAWRDADPRHAAAFARVAGLNHHINRLRPLLPEPELERSRPDRRRLLMALGGFGIAVGAGTVGATLFGAGRSSAETAVGEQRSLILRDGSALEVNTASSVSWQFTDTVRKIWLRQGELALDLMASSVVCQVFAAGQTLRSTQGKFNLRLRGEALELMVLQGQGHIDAGGTEGQGRVIPGGQTAIAADRSIRVRPVTEDERAFVAGWRQGELVLTGQSLGQVIEEYNRYLPHKLVLGDPALSSVHLGGRFKTSDPTVFLTGLEAGFGIRAMRDAEGTIILTK